MQDLAAARHDGVPQDVLAVPGLDQVAGVERVAAERHGNPGDLRGLVERRDPRVGGDVADRRDLARRGSHLRVVAREHRAERGLRADQRGPQGLRGGDQVLDHARQVAAAVEAGLDVGAVDVESGHLLAVADVHGAEGFVLPGLDQVAHRGPVVGRAEEVANRVDPGESTGSQAAAARGARGMRRLCAQVREGVRALRLGRTSHQQGTRQNERAGQRHDRPPELGRSNGTRVEAVEASPGPKGCQRPGGKTVSKRRTPGTPVYTFPFFISPIR